ncbi:MAG TPA: hypothetical protein VM219_09020 [Phycisphaerae bacterium]|nr:hypothetical protein [Phycisphaerae bacterium]HUX02991.1 hypothetical protein [Phycisphaerae bacterium]
MSIIADVADAVAGELAEGTFSKEISVERRWRPRATLSEAGPDDPVAVFVVPKSWAAEVLDRGRTVETVEIDVAVMRKLAEPADDEATIDALMNLVEEIADFFKMRRLASYPLAAWKHSGRDPIYSPQHLDELRQFTSGVTLTYRVVPSA